jgi:hypothetical protein
MMNDECEGGSPSIHHSALVIHHFPVEVAMRLTEMVSCAG